MAFHFGDFTENLSIPSENGGWFLEKSFRHRPEGLHGYTIGSNLLMQL